MGTINAFVGHSFIDSDDAVVRVFLDYFDQVTQAVPGFTWVHAKAAEPKELPSKVLSLIAGKNTFIGICTAREVVVQPDHLRTGWLDRSARSFDSQHAETKTTDWIIQEIGLAVGRGMKLILLLERGCRRPGGLQGDVEFIPFDRAYPERSFGRLLEMIRAIDPLPSTPLSPATEARPEPTNEVAVTEEDVAETPNSSWDLAKFKDQYLWRLFDKDQTAADEINRYYVEGPAAGKAELHAEWAAYTESWKIFLNRDGKLDRLRQLQLDFPNNPDIAGEYAGALAKYSEHFDAARLYKVASNTSITTQDKIRYMSRAAVELAKFGDCKTAFDLIRSAQLSSNDEASAARVWLYALREISVVINDYQLELETYEHWLSIFPDDFDNRFELAYRYSERGHPELALCHYLKIPHASRSAAALNNLGVSYQKFNLPSKSIQSYRDSAAKGETLARSNLAYKLMNAGFLPEAQKELNEAVKDKDVHKNVGDALSQLQGTAEREDKELEELLRKAEDKAAFFKKLGVAATAGDAVALKAKYQGPDCMLDVKVDGKSFVASGAYERSAGLLGLIGTPSQPRRYEIRFSGELRGRRVFGSVTRKQIGDAGGAASLLGGSDDEKKFAIIFDELGAVGSVLENLESSVPSRYDIAGHD